MDKENDLFNDIIKEKLVNFTLPVDDDSWNKLLNQLNAVPRKKTRRRWMVATAVAASIPILFLLFPINKKTYSYETASQLSDHEKTIIQDVPEKEIVQSAPQQNVESPSVFKKSKAGERLAENNLATEVIPKEESSVETPSVPEKEEVSTQEKQPVPPDSYFDFSNEILPPIIKQKKQHSVRFSFGSGGNLLAENTANMSQSSNRALAQYLNSGVAYYRSATQEISSLRMEDILSYEKYPNITYHLPLSFGITLKKELNQRFALESGFVYSFVATTFSREAPMKSNADLQLHYIGIPLNIHTRIFGNRFSRWEVYLSAGGMVEKGLLSHFVQKNYYDNDNNNNDNAVMTVNSNEKIKGLQWSLGISPGIDYQIHKNYSIYLEPKMNYYFDNGQPISIRTEHPVVIGINAGLRFTW